MEADLKQLISLKELIKHAWFELIVIPVLGFLLTWTWSQLRKSFQNWRAKVPSTLTLGAVSLITSGLIIGISLNLLTMAFAHLAAGPSIQPRFTSIVTLDLNEADEPKLPGPGCLVLWDLEIFNTGSPTVLRDWAFSVKGVDGKVTQGFNVILESAFTNSVDHKVYRPEDSIVLKTKNNPITTGGAQNGNVTFAVTGKDFSYLTLPETIWSVSFRDASGKQYSVDSYPPSVTPRKKKP